MSRRQYTHPMASRRARRQQAEAMQFWDVWLTAALVSAVMLTIGGWLEARLLGALAGALVGVAIGAISVWHNATAMAILVDAVHGVRARYRRHPTNS